MSNAEVRPPLPPFTRESAIEKVRLAEDGWNSRDPSVCRWPTPWTPNGETAPSSPTTAKGQSVPDP
jgi:hypothetical protein